MSWLFVIIWIPLFMSFCLGAVLATVWWVWRSRSINAEYEKRRLSAEAESDRLRLRISSLKEAEARADDLALDLEKARADAAKTATLEKQVVDLQAQVGLVSELENQVTNLRARADDADRLERELAQCRRQAEPAPSDNEREIDGIEPTEPTEATGGAGPAAAGEASDGTGSNLFMFDLPAADHTDDLQVIKGIGPSLEAKLNGLGIRTWEQLAQVSNGQLEAIGAAIAVFPGRITRDRWMEQAEEFIRRFPLTDPYHRPSRKTLKDFE